MKITLLLLCTIASTLSFGQKKLSSIVINEYDEFGNTVGIDSLAYTYNSWIGSLTENKMTPQFSYYDFILMYNFEEPTIHCDKQEIFSGTTYPLTPGDVTNNLITNGRVSQSQVFGDIDRKLYEYNGLGQLTKTTSETVSSGSWFVTDSTTQSYDTFGNRLTVTNYKTSSLIKLRNTDTVWYAPGSTRPIKSVYYFTNSLDETKKSRQTLVTYSGNDILHIDSYGQNTSGGIDWEFRLNYNYTGNQVDGFLGYEVVANSPSTTSTIEGIFTYTAQNKPASSTVISEGDTVLRTRWEYDIDGFATKMMNGGQAPTSGIVMDYQTYDFNYQNTTGLHETQLVEVTIHPNPTSDELKITSDSQLEHVSVYSLNGQLLLQQKASTVDLSHLPKGNYILKGQTANGAFSESILKK